MTTTIEHKDDAELKRKLTVILMRLGCTIVPRLRWERPKAVRERLGVKSSIFHKRLGNYPGEFPAVMGSRRIRFMHVTTELRNHLKGNR